MQFRAAEERDLPELTRIYNHYVETSHVTFDLKPFEVEQRWPWFETFSRTGRHRLFVAEAGRDVMGHVGSAPWRPKPAYATTVELSVYCAHDSVRRGVGRALCNHLLNELRNEDIERVVGGAALPNPGSVALLTSLGFRQVGTFTSVGRKFDQYWDVAWFEKGMR